METLVQRASLMQRNGAHFVTIRRWRSSMKQFQIDALRRIKQDPPPRFVNAVADDILAHVDSMIGGQIYHHVVPIPCSRSHPDACLPSLLAEKLAARLGLTPLRALALDPANGGSHPKANVARPKIRLVLEVTQPIILVDDVVSSGAHMEEGMKLLRPGAKAVFGVAWIGGKPA